MKDVRLLDRAFDPNPLIDALAMACPAAGGLATFLGKVRMGEGVEALALSHYEPLTLPGMDTLADAALGRFDLEGLLIVHRTGLMHPGEPIVLVSAAARHRRDAIQAVDFAMDHLKSDSWFWKREKRVDGWHWIEPRAQDADDILRWS
ncbi:MAG: molybdenum cofactor biosynthesis protein MoaE [Sphingomonadaceae bacterium]|nr:molybdenum cofactor biosynthesis protein MoaE [Sphingomonadaceae bacterium]